MTDQVSINKTPSTYDVKFVVSHSGTACSVTDQVPAQATANCTTAQDRNNVAAWPPILS